MSKPALRTNVYDVEYYAKYYPNYQKQNPPTKHAYYRSILSEHSAGLPRSVHDVGCAFGDFLESLGTEWTHRIGTDVNEAALIEARKRGSKVQFLSGDLAKVSENLKNLGAVTAFDVLEHIPDLEKTAVAIRQELTRGGLFVFVVPVYDGPLGPIVSVLDHDTTHIHKRSRADWLNWANSHFDVIRWEGVFRYLMPGGYYAHFPTKLLRSIAPALVVVCRRR